MKTRKIFIPFMIIIITITGCRLSMYRFFYDSIDSFLLLRIDGYFDITSEQKTFLRERLKKHLEWHRFHEITLYIETLQGVLVRINDGLDKKEIEWTVGRISSHYDSIYRHIADDMVKFLATLEDRQVERFEKKIRKEVKKTEEEEAEKLADKEKSIKEAPIYKVLNFIYGDFTDSQENQIAGLVNEMLDVTVERRKNYRKRMEHLINALKNRKDHKALKKSVFLVLVEPEKLEPKSYIEKMDSFYKQNIKAFLYVEKNIIVKKQREYAVKRVNDFISVFRGIQEDGR